MTASACLARVSKPPRTVVVAGDLGACGASARLVAGFATFLADHQPDELVAITRPASYCHGDTGAHLSLRRSVEVIRQRGYAGTMLLQSNWRSEAVIAPACQHGRPDATAALEGFGVEEITGYHTIAPGWMTVCAASSAPWAYPAALAIRLARILGTSVTVGGTRALGILTERAGPEALTPRLCGSEIGTFKTLNRRAPREWSRGFLLLEVTVEEVRPTAIDIHNDNSFAVSGTRYY